MWSCDFDKWDFFHCISKEKLGFFLPFNAVKDSFSIAKAVLNI